MTWTLLLWMAAALAASPAAPLIDIARGHFDGQGREQTVLYQTLGPSAGVTLSELANQVVENDIRFYARDGDRVEMIGIIKRVRFPMRTTIFKWAREKAVRASVLVEASDKYYMIHYQGGTWQITPLNEFFHSLMDWLGERGLPKATEKGENLLETGPLVSKHGQP